MEGQSKQTMKDGKTTTAKWTTPKIGGIQSYQEGPPAAGITTVAVVIDAGNVYQVTLMNGVQVGLGHIAFSKDFKAFTLSGKAPDASGKPVEYFGLYEKQ
jgi:hypothetical protein